MRKFKLLKFYPSLNKDWKEGLVVIKDPDNFYRPINTMNSPGRIISSFVEDYPEFWEEIIEKDYEVLEINYNNPRANQCWDLTYKNDICIKRVKSGVELSIAHIVKLSQFSTEDWKYTTILKIRRKSDGVEFKIGDRVLNSKGQFKTICNFKTNSSTSLQVELGTGNFVDYIDTLCNIQHYKEPILITEDGYEMYEGDTVWIMDMGFKMLGIRKLESIDAKMQNSTKFFKIKENAEKYIYENKPEFSRKQILDAISSNIGFSVFGLGDVIIESDFKHTLKL